MSFSLGPRGGVQDEEILRLLAKLTSLIQEHGLDSACVSTFISEHAEKVFVDKHSNHMHSFKELASAVGLLIQGLVNEEPTSSGDSWKKGNNTLFEKDPDEPSDWWKP